MLRAVAQDGQLSEWPQGKKTILICWSKQILQSKASFRLEFDEPADPIDPTDTTDSSSDPQAASSLDGDCLASFSVSDFFSHGLPS